MKSVRSCRRPGCENPAVATLTSVYSDSTIVIGPLATERQPEAYDLCAKHVDSFTAPRGWQVIRLATSFEPAPPSEDDLLALADAVRDASRSPRPRPRPAEHAGRHGAIMAGSLTAPPEPSGGPVDPDELPDHLTGLGDGEILRRGHLRVLRGERED